MPIYNLIQRFRQLEEYRDITLPTYWIKYINQFEVLTLEKYEVVETNVNYTETYII